MTRQLLIYGLILLTNQLIGQSTVLIQDAVDHKMIDYKISGSWNRNDKQQFLDADGQYFGKCMTIEIKSKTDSTFWIHIINGLMLICEDTSTQDMIITKPIYVKLKPKSTKTIQLYAMCSEIHDGMPHRQTAFKIGKVADDNLISITKSIDDMFMHNVVGQGAVWAYTDNATKEELRKYGATNASLELTIQVLNKAGVTTQLNTPSQPITDIDTTVAQLDKVPTIIPDKKIITLDAYIVYSGAGVILLLLGSTIFLIFRKEKTKQDNPTVS